MLFGIPRSIDLALVGVHVAVEPDNQITVLGFILAEIDEFINGHVGTVARIILSRKFPAELQGAFLVQAEVDTADAVRTPAVSTSATVWPMMAPKRLRISCSVKLWFPLAMLSPSVSLTTKDSDHSGLWEVLRGAVRSAVRAAAMLWDG